MNKRHFTIEEYKNKSGAYTVTINNARYRDCFQPAVEQLIHAFLLDREVFFAFCRTDGVNLSPDMQKNLQTEIPAFFSSHGNFQSLNEYLTTAQIKLDNHNCGFVPMIFDYYLETVMFAPNVDFDWEDFKRYHADYQNHRFDEIILNHFADMLFYYYDSGDLSICFDPQKYSPIEVRGLIDLFFGV